MTVLERVTLINAGYTKAEIEAMQEAAPAPDPTPAPDPVPAPDPAPAPDPIPAPNNDNAAILAAIANLTRAIQADNVQSRGYDMLDQMTAERALAQGVFGNK